MPISPITPSVNALTADEIARWQWQLLIDTILLSPTVSPTDASEQLAEMVAYMAVRSDHVAFRAAHSERMLRMLSDAIENPSISRAQLVAFAREAAHVAR